jgi:hypothetical protein
LYAKQNDLNIVGWYHGNARSDDTVLPERAIKAAETIKKNNADKAIIFLVCILLKTDFVFTAIYTCFIIDS